MNTHFPVSDAFVRALGWALAHSLWQATLAALLLLILLPRLQTARQRYWAAYGALATVFVAAIVTLGLTYHPDQYSESAGAGITDGFSGGAFFIGDNQSFSASVWEKFSVWLDTYHALIVAVWLLGFGFFLLRLGGGLWHVQRLRTRGVAMPDTAWLECFNTLRQRLGFTRAVRLLESALVHSPMAIGWLRPVVLLPIGLVNRLSVAEVEAVLAHELAHIARKDWVFNLLQAFFESLFYYHPAVWWISAVVRRERENCCDDAALAATGNPLAFAKALVQVQEMAVPVPVLALGLSGPRRRPLLDRVRRILNQPQQRQYQVMEKITATVILLALLALVGLKANSVPTLKAAFSQISDFPTALFGGQTDNIQITNDSLPKPKITRKITREDDKQKVEAEYQDGKLTKLSVDGKEIPESEFNQHQALVSELMEEAAPTPPTPPTPPPGFWGRERPEAPEAPERPERPEAPEHSEIWEFPTPPMPPFPPDRVAPALVYSGKDADGNTIIRLNNDGESTELVVKGSDVYVNGKKLEKGESIGLPGMEFGSNGGFSPAEGFSYGFGDSGNGASAGSPEDRAAYNRKRSQELKQAMEERQRAMEDNKRSYERDMKLAQEELQRSQKDQEKEQKRWEKEQKNWELEQKKWEKEQEKWQQDQHKWQAEQQDWEAKHKAMEAALKSELLKDGLITNTENFSLQLTNKELKVNKKKLSEELHRKYQELIEGMTGEKLNNNGSFLYNYSDDDK